MDTLAFKNSDLQETRLEDYRSVSALAIVALVVGFLSVSALANPLLWFIPIAGLIIALIAVLRIRWHSERLSGSGIATVGLLLSLFFLGWAPAKHFSSRWIMESRSKEYVIDWLRTVLNGDLEKAHQAHTYYWSRQPEGTSLKEYYQSSVVMRNQLEEFFGAEILRQLTRFSSASEITHLETRVIYFGSDHVAAIHLLEIREGKWSLRLNVEAERIEKFDDIYWSIVRIHSEDEISEESSDRR